MTTISHTHYEVLGLTETASLDQIKKRYRDLVRRFHPDVPRTGNEIRFKAIQEAYDVLSDTTRRADYDLTLRSARTAAPTGARPAAGNGAAGSAAPGAAGAASPHAADGSSAQAGPAPGTAGDVIAGKYRIVREIARSNDVVYEAQDLTMGRRVAVKELLVPANLTGQARRERIERFNREARAAGKLSHPNIVTVYAYGEDRGRYFIAMEYLEGGTLRDTLQSRGALPVSEAVDVAVQVLAGLDHAHAHQVVHRDIKPDNIHLLPGGVVKLTDFGIARLTEEASLTGEGQIFGTPSYMSPEQIKGAAVDHRSDLFSLGIVLYEMLAGRKPFTGDSVISITYSILENSPPPLTGVSYGLEQVVYKALTKDARQRFYSAEQMRRELKAAEHAPDPVASAGFQTGLGFGGLNGAAPAATVGMSAAPPFGGGAPFSPPAPQAPFGVSLPGPPAGAGAGAYAGYGGGGSAVGALTPVPAGGPFVNWNPQSAHLPAGYAPPPPPFPVAPPRPIMSDATKTFFKVLALAVVLGCVLLAGVLLFQSAYDQQKKTGQELKLSAMNADAKRLYDAHDVNGAIAAYGDVMRQAPASQAGKDARTSLVTIYRNMGVQAFNAGNYRDAENAWFQGYNLDPNNQDINDYLQKLYDRVGDKDDQLRDWKQTATAGSDINTPGDTSFFQQQNQTAQTYYNQGVDAYNRGDVDAARADWTKAAGIPGTEWSQKAREMLNQTDTSLNGG